MDPLTDQRWRELVEWHPDATVFHSVGWLRALSETYQYRPVVFASNESGKALQDGLVACEVRSLLTGNRLVSLPFSDHCDLLPRVQAPVPKSQMGFKSQSSAESKAGAERRSRQITVDPEPETRYWEPILEQIQRFAREQGHRYVELRPKSDKSLSASGYRLSAQYAFHQIDLGPSEEELLASFHHSSIRRQIRRAKRAGLDLKSGTEKGLLEAFYQLLMATRRRHGVPPQPRRWFENLVRFLGDSVRIHLASLDGTPVAAILTLRFREQLVYKYGGSDSRYHSLGAIPLLFWMAIRQAKREGLSSFDLGRSDLDNPGLIRFKSNWTSNVSQLSYWRSGSVSALSKRISWPAAVGHRIVRYLPDRLLELSGRALYRHLG